MRALRMMYALHSEVAEFEITCSKSRDSYCKNWRRNEVGDGRDPSDVMSWYLVEAKRFLRAERIRG